MALKLFSTTNKKQTTTKTENTYNKLPYKVDYDKYFVKVDTSTPNYYYPDIKTDDDIYSEATNRVKDLYDTYLQNEKDSTDYAVDKLKESLSYIDDSYKTRYDSLKSSYDNAKDNIENQTLSRGMGRSSLKTDMLNQNSNDYANDVRNIDTLKQRDKDDVNDKIEDIRQQSLLEQKEIMAKKNSEIEKLASEMKKDRDKQIFDAQKYNNQLYMDKSKLVLSQVKHNLDVQKYIDSMNVIKTKITTTTTTSSTSVYKDKNDTAHEIYTEFNSLSDLEKVAYYDANKYKIQKASKDLDSELSKQVQAITAKNLLNYFPHLQNVVK